MCVELILLLVKRAQKLTKYFKSTPLWRSNWHRFPERQHRTQENNWKYYTRQFSPVLNTVNQNMNFKTHCPTFVSIKFFSHLIDTVYLYRFTFPIATSTPSHKWRSSMYFSPADIFNTKYFQKMKKVIFHKLKTMWESARSLYFRSLLSELKAGKLL
jgi:hypothetical protein